MVLDLAAGQPLFVDEDKAFARENEKVPDQLVRLLDALAPREHPREIPLYFRRFYLRRVPHQPIEQPHVPSHPTVLSW